MKHLRDSMDTAWRWVAPLAGCLLISACGGSAPASSETTTANVASAGGLASGSVSVKPAISSLAASAKPTAGASLGGQIAAKPGTINIAMVGGSPTFAPIWIGADNGLFDKYNLPVNLFVTTAAPAMAALLNGQVQVAMEGGSMVGADPSGTKLAFIVGVQNAFNQFVVSAKPSIKSLTELKGHTVAATSPGSAATVAFEKMLASAGLKKTDVKWVYLGTAAAEWTALQNGQVDATPNAWPYYLFAKQAGFAKLADGKEINIPGTALTMAVSRMWAQANAPLVEALLKGTVEGVSLANVDRARFEASVSKHLSVSDQAQLDDAFERYSGTFPMPPYITKEAVQEAIDDEPNADLKQHKPEDYIDNGPLDALVASGFTKQFEKK